jgi:ABC-type enterobactin transport system permease subunit
MAHVGTLEKATMLATFARLAYAAVSTVTVVAPQITAPLQRAAKVRLVVAQVRLVS